jgi:hypothetical protein
MSDNVPLSGRHARNQYNGTTYICQSKIHTFLTLFDFIIEHKKTQTAALAYCKMSSSSSAIVNARNNKILTGTQARKILEGYNKLKKEIKKESKIGPK